MIGVLQGWGVYLPHWLIILSLFALAWLVQIARRLTLLRIFLFITYVCVISALACPSP